LDYTKTSKNIIYYDLKSKEFKTAQHMGFNEAMNGVDSPSPNAQLLRDVRTPSDAAVIDIRFEQDAPHLDVSPTPFLVFRKVTMPLDLDHPHPRGLEVARCPVCILHTPFLHYQVSHWIQTRRFSPTSSALLYILSINNTPVFSLKNVDNILDDFRRLTTPPTTIEVLLAPERKTEYNDADCPTHLRLTELRPTHSCIECCCRGRDDE
jgi:hypothetical protein